MSQENQPAKSSEEQQMDDYEREILEKNNNLVQKLKTTGQTNWEIIGDYESSVFNYLTQIQQNCQTLNLQIYQLDRLPTIHLQNIIQCKVKIDTQYSKILLETLNMEKLERLEIEMDQGCVSLQGNLKSLKYLQLKAYLLNDLDFTGVVWEKIQTINLQIRALNQLKGFEKDNQSPPSFPKLKQFKLKATQQYFAKFDIRNFSLSSQLLKLIIEVPRSKLIFDLPYGIDIGTNQFTVLILGFDSSSKQPNILSQLQLHGLTTEKIAFNQKIQTLKHLSIKNSLTKQINFNNNLQNLESIEAYMTKIQSLNLTEFNNLKTIKASCNNIKNIQINKQQLQNLNQIFIDYNENPQQIFNGFSSNNIWSKLKFNNCYPLDYIISKLSESQFAQLEKLYLQKYPNQPERVQISVQLGKQWSEFNQNKSQQLQYWRNTLQKWKTVESITNNNNNLSINNQNKK